MPNHDPRQSAVPGKQRWLRLSLLPLLFAIIVTQQACTQLDSGAYPGLESVPSHQTARASRGNGKRVGAEYFRDRMAKNAPPSAYGAAEPGLADQQIASAVAAPQAAGDQSAELAMTSPAMPEKARLPASRVQATGKNMSLLEAINIAISRHPNISQANALIAQSSSNVAIAKAARYPTLEYGISPGYDRTDGRGGVNASAGINQLIYDFGRTPSTIAAAQADEQQSRHILDDTIEAVAYETAIIFVDLVTSQEIAGASAKQVAALNHIRDMISQRVDAGLSDATDLNLADAAVQRAEAEALKAATRANIAMGKLSEFIGTRPASVENLQSVQKFTSALHKNGSNIDGTPAVQAAHAAVDAAAARLRVAEAERWPQIGLNARHSLNSNSNNNGDNTTVGLSVGGSFSFGGLAKNKISAAEAERSAAAHSLENRRLAVRSALETAELEASGAAAVLVSYEKVIAITKAQRELSWQEYTLNKRPLTTVIDVEKEIFQAESERAMSIAEGIAARIRSYSTVGKFVAFLREQIRG